MKPWGVDWKNVVSMDFVRTSVSNLGGKMVRICPNEALIAHKKVSKFTVSKKKKKENIHWPFQVRPT